ncbi:MAG TPA: hypothetical protein VHS32_04545 [Streptosporangiaceae bacterium]|nr:hypothetical protein [Streptosporangiaceae bacterium]
MISAASVDWPLADAAGQPGAGIAAAFSRLRAYAYVNDLRLTDVARDIVARRLRLQPDPAPSPEGDG